jgi:hypothetical protein
MWVVDIFHKKIEINSKLLLFFSFLHYLYLQRYELFSYIKIIIIMGTDIDYIISLMKEFTPKATTDELGEQEDTTTTSDTGGEKPDYPTITKWETGVVRGPANQIGNTKWSDSVKPVRGKGNTLL